MNEIQVRRLEDLYDNEREILERVNARVNGGFLFLIHPFRLLGDVDVIVSDDLRRTLSEHDPHLSALSNTTYDALAKNEEPFDTKVRVRGLFQRRKE